MSQVKRLKELLDDGKPHRTDEIMEKVYGSDHLGLARVGARVRDLKDKGCIIQGWRDEEKQSLYWYQLVSEGKELLEIKKDFFE